MADADPAFPKYTIVAVGEAGFTELGEIQARTRSEAVEQWAELHPNPGRIRPFTSREINAAAEHEVEITVETKPVVTLNKTRGAGASASVGSASSGDDD